MTENNENKYISIEERQKIKEFEGYLRRFSQEIYNKIDQIKKFLKNNSLNFFDEKKDINENGFTNNFYDKCFSESKKPEIQSLLMQFNENFIIPIKSKINKSKSTNVNQPPKGTIKPPWKGGIKNINKKLSKQKIIKTKNYQNKNYQNKKLSKQKNYQTKKNYQNKKLSKQKIIKPKKII